MEFNIDIAIVASFLILTLLVGVTHGHKIKDIREYALGDCNFSTGTLVATISATWLSGSGFFTILSKTYTDGLYFFIPVLFIAVQLLITAFLIIPRMDQDLGSTSIAESMGILYGKEVRIITAIAGTIGSTGLIAVQFKAFGNIISYFTIMNDQIAVISAGIVVTMYSMIGGVRAVTVTDTLQLFTFCFALPLLGVSIWNQLYFSDTSISASFAYHKFDLLKVMNIGNPKFWEIVSLSFYFMVPGMGPAVYQRISMARNIDQIKKAFIISAIIIISIEIITAWVPFLLYSINPDLGSHEVLGFIIDHYTYTGLRGVLIIGVIAMAMSTADSGMNSSSILISHDICSNNQFVKKYSLYFAQFFTLLLGCGGIGLALYGEDLLAVVLTANSFYMPVVTIPFLFSIVGFRSSKYSILAGMFGGFTTVIIWKICGFKVNPISFAMLVNAITILTVHYFFRMEGGWIKNRNKTLKSYNDNKIHRNSIFYKSYLKRLLSKYLPRDELSYAAFGLYCVMYTISTMYAVQIELTSENRIILILYQIMMVTGTMMTIYPLWPKMIRASIGLKIMRVWWLIAIFYMLIIFSGFFVIISNFGQLQFVIFTLNTVIAIILVGWQISLLMMLTGFYLSICIFDYYNNYHYIELSWSSPQFVFMYSLVLIGSTLLLFLKPQQERYEETEAKVEVLEGEVQDLDSTITALQNKEMQYQSEISSLNEAVDHYSERVADQAKEIERLGATAQKILNNVNHELRLPVGNVMNFAEMLYEGLGNYSQEQLKELTDEVYQNSTRLSTMILNMLDLATLDVKKVGLVKSTENFSELVRDRVKICRNIYLQGKPIDFKLIIEPEILISIDPNYMRQVVDNLVINAINFSEKGTIEIEVRRNDDAVVMILRDQGKGIPREELFDIFKPFKMGSNSECQSQGRGVGLALCKSAVEAHGGSILAESPGGIGALFTIILMR